MALDPVTDETPFSISKRYDISVEKLEPDYITKCKDVKELERILRILRSGEEGHYPHVEQICEDRLKSLNPTSRALRHEERLQSIKDLSNDIKDSILDDLKNWTNEMKSQDKASQVATRGTEGNENLPPVRGKMSVNYCQPSVSPSKEGRSPKIPKSVKPKDYKEWDKIVQDIDEKEEDISQPPKDVSKPQPQKVKGLATQINAEGMSCTEKEMVANREKDKGNESFRCGDYLEALAYYNRSIGVLPSPATYNNRALAYIRLSKWSDAVGDCNKVLAAESGNIKAKLRRAVAYKSQRKFKQAKDDLDFVLEKEPHNKRALDLLKEIQDFIKEENTLKAEGKGHRMIIEETDGESSQEDDSLNSRVHRAADSPKRASDSTAPPAPHDRQEPTICPSSEPKHMAKPARRIQIEETSSDGEEADSEGEDKESPPPAAVPASGIPKENGASRKAPTRSSSLYNIIKQNVVAENGGQHSKYPPSETQSPHNSDAVREPSAHSANLTAASVSRHDSPAEASLSKRTTVENTKHTDIISERCVDAASLPVYIERNLDSQTVDTTSQNSTSTSKVTPEAAAFVRIGDPAAVIEPVSTDVNATREAPAPREAPATKETPAPDKAGCAVANIDGSSEDLGSAECQPHEASSKWHEPTVVFVQPLPQGVEALKNRGNDLFRMGRYSEALRYYTEAMDGLGQDHDYHLATLLNNRAACHLKVGDCRSAISDCTSSLERCPHNSKALLRRASAHETLERYTEAFVDYRHTLNVEPSSEAAQVGVHRCQKVLTQQFGSKWRERLPKIPSYTNLVSYQMKTAFPVESTKNISQSICYTSEDSPQIINESSNIVSGSKSCKQESSDSSSGSSTKTPKPPSSSSLPRDQKVPEQKVQQKTSEQKVPGPNAQQKTSEQKVETLEQTFNRLKDSGNQLVGEGDFTRAIEQYTQALTLFPDRVVTYSNRALCYLRKDKPALAVADCDTALKLEPGHVKALFRRAQAHKMLKKYKESLVDLMALLKIEPNNNPAKQEAELVKNYYREQLQDLKNKTKLEPTKLDPAKKDSVKQDPALAVSKSKNKVPTRVKIEEESESDDDSKSASNTFRKPTKSKAPKKVVSTQKESPTQSRSDISAVPTLSKNPTPFEFTSAWMSLKNSSNTAVYAQLLRQVPPSHIASVLSNKLEPDMLEKIVLCLDKHFSTEELDRVEEYLRVVATVPRFSMVTMLMSKTCKLGLESLLIKLKSAGSLSIDKLRMAYGL